MHARDGWAASLFIVSVTAGALLWAALLVSGSSPALAESDSGRDGKAIFLAQKCNTCHSVEAAGIEAKTQSEKLKGPDLSGVMAAHEPEWIVEYLHKEESKGGKTHVKAFGGSDEELAALIDWLTELQ